MTSPLSRAKAAPFSGDDDDFLARDNWSKKR